MKSRTTTIGFVAALATAAALVAGCTNDNDHDGHSMGSMMTSAPMSGEAPSENNASDHNTADVMWTRMMIPHHQQAVEMAGLATGRTDNAALLALATRIEAAQEPEIDQMTGWLAEWDEPTGMSDTDHAMDGMDADHMGGMMSSEQMAELEALSGREFDRAWLTMMIDHHQGAVDSAQTVRTDGRSTQVRELADRIVTSQQAEIETMRSLLGQ